MYAMQSNSEAPVSSAANIDETTDSALLSRLSQLVADKHVNSDVIDAFIRVITDIQFIS